MTPTDTMTGGNVQSYYDANTRRFLVVGGSGSALAMHRPLWAEGVTTTQEAAAHINDVIGDVCEQHLGHPPSHVVDLGCGVGGTLFHLSSRWANTALTGITISAVQRRRAAEEARRRELDACCRFLQADFTAPPEATQGDGRARADLAIAIESHVHATSASAFLKGAGRFVAPGGLLVIVDDMLTRPESDLSPVERHWLAAFRTGWRLGHVPDRDGLLEAAASAGFVAVETRDLTPLIRLDRLRDRALHVVGPTAHRLGLNRWPIFGNMIGGDALTRLYRMGSMGYSCIVLQRRRASDTE